MIEELAVAITSKFNANIALKKVLTGGLHFTQAPQDTSMPFGTFDFISINKESMLGNPPKDIVKATVQITVFSDADDGGSQIAQLSQKVMDCYDWSELKYHSFYTIKVERQIIGPVLYIDEIWQVNIDYEIWFIKE